MSSVQGLRRLHFLRLRLKQIRLKSSAPILFAIFILALVATAGSLFRSNAASLSTFSVAVHVTDKLGNPPKGASVQGFMESLKIGVGATGLVPVFNGTTGTDGNLNLSDLSSVMKISSDWVRYQGTDSKYFSPRVLLFITHIDASGLLYFEQDSVPLTALDFLSHGSVTVNHAMDLSRSVPNVKLSTAGSKTGTVLTSPTSAQPPPAPTGDYWQLDRSDGPYPNPCCEKIPVAWGQVSGGSYASMSVNIASGTTDDWNTGYAIGQGSQLSNPSYYSGSKISSFQTQSAFSQIVSLNLCTPQGVCAPTTGEIWINGQFEGDAFSLWSSGAGCPSGLPCYIGQNLYQIGIVNVPAPNGNIQGGYDQNLPPYTSYADFAKNFHQVANLQGGGPYQGTGNPTPAQSVTSYTIATQFVGNQVVWYANLALTGLGFLPYLPAQVISQIGSVVTNLVGPIGSIDTTNAVSRFQFDAPPALQVYATTYVSNVPWQVSGSSSPGYVPIEGYNAYVGDFSITTNSSIATGVGTSANAVITVAPSGGFSGPVALTDNVPAGLSCGPITPASVVTSGTATVSCSSSSLANYALTITGTSQSTVHSATVQFSFQDFFLQTEDPPPVNAGSPATITIDITSRGSNGWSSPITLSDSVPNGVTCGSLPPNPVNPMLPPNQPFVVWQVRISCTPSNLGSPPNSGTGSYTVGIAGTSGSLSHSWPATVTWMDYYVTANSHDISVFAGSPLSATFKVTPFQGWTGPVTLGYQAITLAQDGLPKLTCSLNPSTVTLDSSQTPQSVTLSCNGPVGRYLVYVTGTSGSMPSSNWHTDYTEFTVEDYAISSGHVSPSDIGQGQSGTAAITLTSANLATTISLSLSNVSPSVSNGPTVSLSTNSLQLKTGGTNSTTLNIQTTSLTPAGTYTVTITARDSSGTLIHSTTLQFMVAVPDFSIASTQNTQLPIASSTVASNLVVSSLFGYAGTISLSYSITSSGLTCTLSQATVTITSGSTGISVLTCSGSPGLYNVTITGVNGAVSHSLILPFTVFGQTLSFAGVNAIVTSIFTRPSPTSLLFGTTSLSETVQASGTTIMSNTLSMSFSDKFVAETPNAPFWLAVSCSVKLNTTSTCSFTRTPDIAYAGGGAVDIIDAGYLTRRFGTTPTSAIWDPRADLANHGQVDSFDLSIMQNFFGKPIFLMTPSILSISTQAGILVFPAGSSSSTTITLTSQNSWSGSLSLATTVSPSGPTCSLSPASGTLTSGGTITSTLNCSSTSTGSYSIVVSGASQAGLGNNVLVHLNATDFSISANPTSASESAATRVNSTITLTSLNGLQGTVTLSVQLPSNATVSGVTYLYWQWNGCSVSDCSLSQTLSPGGTATPTLSLWSYSNTPVGNYIIIVTGTSGSLSHSVTITLTVTAYISSGGGGGGSLAEGTMITMANGSQVAVQNVNVGDQLLGYDPLTGTYSVSTVTAVKIVHTSTLLVIHTADGSTLRTDASPTEVLWTRLQNGTSLWLPVTQLQSGDDLWTQNGWVPVTSITSVSTGQHTMYDITATLPYFANGYLDPPHPS